MNELETVASHPQLRARNRFATIEGFDGRELEVLVTPFGLNGLPQRLDPVPGLGQHNAEILQELAEED